MKTVQKAALSLLITVVVFSGFSVLAFSGLFNIIETRFYNQRVTNSMQQELREAAEVVDDYHQKYTKRLESILDQDYIKRSFLPNLSAEDINKRANLFEYLQEELSGFLFVRFLDARGNIHYSTLDSDIRERADFSITYMRLEDVIPPEEVSSYLLEKDDSNVVKIDGKNGHILFLFPFYDTLDIFKGTAVFYVSSRDFKSFLLQKNILVTGQEVDIIDGRGYLIHSGLSLTGEVLEQIRETWDVETKLVRKKNVVESDSGNTFALLSRESDQFSYNLGMLLPDNIFTLNNYLKIILMASFFVTLFLLLFLILSLKQDKVLVLSERIKRFQVNFLKEYVENKESIDWEKWKRELGARRELVKREIKRGIGNIKGTKEETVDNLIDKSWNEIIEVLGSKVSDQPTSARLSEKINIENLEEALERVLKSGTALNVQYTQTDDQSMQTRQVPSIPSPPGGETSDFTAGMKPIEVEEIDETDDIEEIGEADEIDEIEAAEEIEELGEVEELEETEPVEEELVGEAAEAEAIEEIEEIEEIGADENVEELGEVEESEDVESAEEELKETEPIEEEEAEEKIEEVPSVEGQLEEIDDEGEAEEIEEISGDEEEFEEEFEEVGPEEEAEPTEVEEELVPDETEEIEEPQEIEGDFPEEIEEVEEVPEDEAEEVEEVEEADEIDEQFEELEELEEVPAIPALHIVKAEADTTEDIEELDEAEMDAEISEVVFDKVSGGYSYSTLFRSGFGAGSIPSIGKPPARNGEETAELEEIQDENGNIQSTGNSDIDSLLDKNILSLLTAEDVLKLVPKDELSVIEERDGVFTISEDAISKKGGDVADKEFQKLTEEVLAAEKIRKSDKSTIEDLFSFSDVDLSLDLSIDEETEGQSGTGEKTVPGGKKGTLANTFTEDGMDLDALFETMEHLGIAPVKGLMKLSKTVDAVFIGVLAYDNGAFKPELTIGLDNDSIQSFMYYSNEDIVQYVLENKNYLYGRYKSIDIPSLKPKISENDKRHLQNYVFIPSLYKNTEAMLFLGFKSEVKSIPDFINLLFASDFLSV